MEITPMKFRKCTCLFCGRITYGSVPETTEHCHICADRFIKQLQTDLKNSQVTETDYQEVIKGKNEFIRVQLKKGKRLQAELVDIRLELSCPETVGMEDKPLYEWAAVVNCTKLLLQAELKDLRDTVQLSCTVPDSCNDPVVLKKYMKICLDEANKEAKE